MNFQNSEKENPEKNSSNHPHQNPDSSGYNGVHYVIELEQAPLASGTRLLFRLLGENSSGTPSNEQESLLFANDMGQIISNELR